ncbi:Arc family DNA-binding protein, partial [Acinetobacter baumannii]|nr:Arc family DNA-binding protein [Acinetobacter baumannii]
EHIFTQYSVRLSNELRTHLKNAAKKNDRSLNKEIIARLEQSLVLEQCPECIKYLQTIVSHERIFEEQYRMFEEINKFNPQEDVCPPSQKSFHHRISILHAI